VVGGWDQVFRAAVAVASMVALGAPAGGDHAIPEPWVEGWLASLNRRVVEGDLTQAQVEAALNWLERYPGDS
jgi:hypothetical protein